MKQLQKYYLTDNALEDITIETIDRIQGITVDYAILYIPGRNLGFALDERRFNVATSRSRSTTLIISDIPLEEMHSISPKVRRFIQLCQSKNSEEIEAQQNTVSLPQQINSNIGVKVVGKIDLSQFERPKKELSKTKKNYYIIDTNVFVNCPEILSKIDMKYPIILSAKVVDELDKMKIKLTEQEKKNAEKALRLLNQETRHQIIYQSADVSLLPDDFDKRSPDNMILSVALKYKDENPIMLTSDNGLQLKCKSQGISTITLKTFLKG